MHRFLVALAFLSACASSVEGGGDVADDKGVDVADVTDTGGEANLMTVTHDQFIRNCLATEAGGKCVRRGGGSCCTNACEDRYNCQVSYPNDISKCVIIWERVTAACQAQN